MARLKDQVADLERSLEQQMEDVGREELQRDRSAVQSLALNVGVGQSLLIRQLFKVLHRSNSPLASKEAATELARRQTSFNIVPGTFQGTRVRSNWKSGFLFCALREALGDLNVLTASHGAELVNCPR